MEYRGGDVGKERKREKGERDEEIRIMRSSTY